MKIHRGVSYFKDEDDLWKVVIDNANFIVALDDSKLGKNRKIIINKNNEKTCKEFIDWLVD